MAEEENKTSTLQIIFGIAAVISAIAILNKIFGRDEGQEQEDKAQAARDLLYKKIPPSFPDYQYLDWANSIYSALFDDFTEDENTIYGIFEKMKNISDVNKTIEAFGHRRATFSLHDMSLPQMITYYFSKSEIKKLNAILANKKILYDF
jgi:hypothetical protein